jgi:hypothetical protein
VLVAMMVLIGGIIAAVTVLGRSVATTAGGAAPNDDGWRWGSNGGPPLIVTIGGAEAVVGRVESDYASGQQLFVAAYDATTLKARWRVGPFGTYSEGYRATVFTVSGAHLAVSDFHSKVHVYDLETGKEQKSVGLTDQTEAMCPIAPNKAWIGQIDKRSTILDLESGTASDGPKPPGCMTPWEQLTSSADREANEKLPKIQGFEPVKQFKTDSTLLVYGKKAPGTATPMLVGLDPQSRAVHWQILLPAVDLATVRDDPFDKAKNVRTCGGRFVGAYGAGQSAWHVASVDAQAGTRQWDTVLKPIFSVDSLNGMECSANRVYIVRMGSVDVIESATGKLVGAIGHETYE